MVSLAQTEPLAPTALNVDRSNEIAAMYHVYFPRVHNYVCCRIDNFHDADDLTSQIFLKVVSHLESYREDKAPFSAWIFRIARNTVTDYYRGRGRRAHLSLDDIAEPLDFANGPDRMVAAAELRQCLHGALQLLSEREREIIALKFWGELSNRSIAAFLGISESNVGVILYRAMRRLRHILDSRGMSWNDGKS